MLDKLRRKFIVIIMALVTAALVLMVGAILFMNYQQLKSDVIQAVEYATTETAFVDRGSGQIFLGLSLGAGEEEGPGADDGAGGDTAGNGGGKGSDAEDAAPEGKSGPKLDEGPRMERSASSDMVATSVYLVSSDGTTSLTLVNVLELSDDEAAAAVAEALANRDTSVESGECATGHLADSDLYYGVRDTMAGSKVAFASGSYVRNSVTSLAVALAAVSACVWAIFLVISVLLARWVVRPAERAWNQQRQFVADASHELKTPLAVMMANNSILLSNADETVESQRRWVESSQAEAHQMLDLVNDMLFLARPENAERQTVREDVDFSAIVERNVLQFEAVCFERGIQLQENIAPGICVLGDAGRLQRLASTLIDNACKYADSQVSVQLSGNGGHVRFAVSNDGAVIPPEDLPHVFDRFYRVDKARVRSEGGVGLGLAIAQEVAHEHGGAITVTSSENAGTTFTATLPRTS